MRPVLGNTQAQTHLPSQLSGALGCNGFLYFLGLELVAQPRVTLYFWSSCLYLLSKSATGVCHHAAVGAPLGTETRSSTILGKRFSGDQGTSLAPSAGF